jgi:hypothetical protein
MGTFIGPRKTADASVLPERRKLAESSGEDFMGICLVAYIPYHLIIRTVKNRVNAQGEFHHSKAGSQMAAGLRNSAYDFLPDFTCNLLKLTQRKVSEAFGQIQPVKKSCHYSNLLQYTFLPGKDPFSCSPLCGQAG